MAKQKAHQREDVLGLIEECFGNVGLLAFPRVYISITGDIKAALLLAQMIYWGDRSIRKDGFFWKSAREWQEEIGLSQKELTRAVNILKELGLIETKKHRANGFPTIHYRVNIQKLKDLIIFKSQILEKSEDDLTELFMKSDFPQLINALNLN